MRLPWLALALLAATPLARAQTCAVAPVQMQILGSGGLELSDTRSGPALLVWVNGRSRLLVDAGPGTATRFVQVGANTADLDAILFTELRAGRSAGLPALVQLSTSTPRTRALPIFGPAGNRWMPSTVSFVRTLFDPTRGAWRHLGELLSPLARGSYKLEPHDQRPSPRTLGGPRERRDETLSTMANKELQVVAVPITSGQTPTLAWRVETQGKRLVISGDVNADSAELVHLAKDADLLVVSHTLSEDATPAERALGIPPTAIGRLAQASGAKQLVLTARSRATLGHEEESTALIRRYYHGTISFADDLDCLTP